MSKRAMFEICIGVSWFRCHGDLEPDVGTIALAGRGMDTRRLQHFLGHDSITNTVRAHD